MKFTDGLMIHTGHPVTEYVDTAVRHVLLRQGVIGLKARIEIFFYIIKIFGNIIIDC
jgi:ribosomal protein S3